MLFKNLPSVVFEKMERPDSDEADLMQEEDPEKKEKLESEQLRKMIGEGLKAYKLDVTQTMQAAMDAVASAADLSAEELQERCIEDLVHMCIENANNPSYETMREYTGCRILQETYQRILLANESPKKKRKGEDSIDFLVRSKKAWEPVVQFLLQSHVQDFLHRFDIEGGIYRRIMSYAYTTGLHKNGKTLGSMMVPSGEQLTSPRQIAYLTATDCTEVALYHMLEYSTIFYKEHRNRWPYDTDVDRLRGTQQRIATLRDDFRAKWEDLYPEAFQRLDNGDYLYRIVQELKEREAGEVREKLECYLEFEDMQQQAGKRANALMERRERIGGEVHVQENDDSSVGVMFVGNDGRQLSVQESFLQDINGKIHISGSPICIPGVPKIGIISSYLRPQDIVMLLHDISRKKMPTVSDRSRTSRKNKIYEMQNGEGDSPSPEEYIGIFKEDVDAVAAMERQSREDALAMMRIVAQETGIDLRKLFTSYEEFRDCMIMAHVNDGIPEDLDEYPDETWMPDPSSGPVPGNAERIKVNFRGYDNSILGVEEFEEDQEEGQKEREEEGDGGIYSRLTNESYTDFDEYVDQVFDNDGREKVLKEFWGNKKEDCN